MNWIEKKWLSLGNPEFLQKYTESFKKTEGQIGAFLQYKFDSLQDGYIPFAVKDNIAVSNFKLTCGSKMLENLLSPYDATAVKKLTAGNGIVVGKTALDEFGMGSSTTTSLLKETKNPWDLSRVTGGSSGGSAAAVASEMVPFALGSDTGGSIRQPASFCGIYGLKPTYGTVSRYGLVSYASSLEVIGILAKKVTVIKNVYEIIRGKDDYDQTSVDFRGSKKEIKKIGILGNLDVSNIERDVHNSYQSSINRIKKLGFEVSEVTFPLFDYIAPAYYTIATAEASANLARYNGVRFGLRPDFSDNPDELVRKSRSEGFGDEVKLRILLGTYVLRSGFQDEYYLKAQKVRTAIRNELDKLFRQVDLLLLPVFPTPPFSRDNPELDPFQQKMADSYTCLANLAGVPALSIPSAVTNNLPVGVQLMGPSFSEENLFDLAEKLEQQFPSPSPPIKLDEWSK